jgi:dephospho-CoA kinase
MRRRDNVAGVRVGLTGGVGSGKSTVAKLLVEHGAVLIDADAIAREVVEPGTPGFDAVVAAFGDEVVGPDGRLDRPKLAGIVFGDEAKRGQLNAIVHPLVGRRTVELAQAAPPDAVVVYDIPLLVENNMANGFDIVLVVEAEKALRLARLAGRGMAADDAQERMAAQVSDEQRREVADVVIENNDTLADLKAAVDDLWELFTEPREQDRAGLEPPSRIG